MFDFIGDTAAPLIFVIIWIVSAILKSKAKQREKQAKAEGRIERSQRRNAEAEDNQFPEFENSVSDAFGRAEPATNQPTAAPRQDWINEMLGEAHARYEAPTPPQMDKPRHEARERAKSRSSHHRESTIRPSASAAERARARSLRTRQERAANKGAKPAPKIKLSRGRAVNLRKSLRSREEMMNAILVAEIIGSPLALREKPRF